MVKLQEIKRTNGSVVNQINIPKNVIEESKLKKGDNLKVITVKEGELSIKKEEDDFWWI